MSRTRAWVSFEDDSQFITSALSGNISSPSAGNNAKLLQEHFRATERMSTSISKYSVFDKLRQEEQNGGDLGWSRELLSTVNKENGA